MGWRRQAHVIALHAVRSWKCGRQRIGHPQLCGAPECAAYGAVSAAVASARSTDLAVSTQSANQRITRECCAAGRTRDRDVHVLQLLALFQAAILPHILRQRR